MFKEIIRQRAHALGNSYYYFVKIIDEDFKEKCGPFLSWAPWPFCYELIIKIYKDKKLNVPANLALFINYINKNFNVDKDYSIFNDQIKVICAPYQSEIDKYSILL